MPREQGPIPLIKNRRRLSAAAQRKRAVCTCSSCVSVQPWRAEARARTNEEMRRRIKAPGNWGR